MNKARASMAEGIDNKGGATCKFALIGKDGKLTKYIGLLDTGSTNSLISKELADRINMKLSRTNGVEYK